MTLTKDHTALWLGDVTVVSGFDLELRDGGMSGFF